MKMRHAIPILYGGLLLGVGAWALLDPQGFLTSGRKTRKKIEKKTGKRLPRPDVVLVGPSDAEGFDVLDGAICQSAADLQLETPSLRETDPGAFIEGVTRRTLSTLYPDYPWPATSGDHPSAAELQGLVRYEVRRQLLDETLCLTETEELPSWADIPDSETFIPSPGDR